MPCGDFRPGAAPQAMLRMPGRGQQDPTAAPPAHCALQKTGCRQPSARRRWKGTMKFYCLNKKNVIDTTWIWRRPGRAQSCSEHESITGLFCFMLCDQRVSDMLLSTRPPAPLGISTPPRMGSRLSSILPRLSLTGTVQPQCRRLGQQRVWAAGSGEEPLCSQSLLGTSHWWHGWRATAFVLGPGLAFVQDVSCAWQWPGVSSHPDTQH